jgi:hypothetical protein
VASKEYAHATERPERRPFGPSFAEHRLSLLVAVIGLWFRR